MYKFENQKVSIYNSLNGKKELFIPINKGAVGMYVCGPTVYSNVHLGNVRTFMSFDVIYRYLLHLGFKVRYVRNITDVGHIVDDVDDGEDKIAKKARLEKLEPMEIVQKYTTDFHFILNHFNLFSPSIEPTATGHLIEQIEYIKKLISNGFAYEVNGSVYFDVLKYNKDHNYGKLSGRNIEELLDNTRILDGQSDKKNPQDFALWKKADPQHIMRWPSPWSDGFPGWHLECSAMSTKYLGTNFDIHGGGMDLKFPHHECEIAQNQACNQTDGVNYWMHANMLTLNGKKMSKSTDNNILPHEIFSGENKTLTKTYSPAVARFFMMQAHYRSILDFSDDAITAAEKGFIRLQEGLKIVENITPSKTSTIDVAAWVQQCYDAMNDDFNTPILIAHLFEGIKYVNVVNDKKEQLTATDIELLKNTLNAFVYDVLGIPKNTTNTNNTKQLEGAIGMLIKMRDEARANKNWALSDEIRDELAAAGIVLKDSKEGTQFSF